jgi:hypothetical protein
VVGTVGLLDSIHCSCTVFLLVVDAVDELPPLANGTQGVVEAVGFLKALSVVCMAVRSLKALQAMKSLKAVDLMKAVNLTDSSMASGAYSFLEAVEQQAAV